MLETRWLVAGGFALLVGSLFAFQRQFREYPAIEYNDFPFLRTQQKKPSSHSRV